MLQEQEFSRSSRNGNCKDKEVSIIIPLYNEGPNINYLFERLESVLSGLDISSYELICINDGSSDDTLDRLMCHYHRNPNIRILNLSRNFGKELALTAGIDYAQGEAVIPIDADLQDPPEMIEELIGKWREGYDVVYAVRSSRKGETLLKRATAGAFYHIIDNMSRISIPRNTGDFRLLDRCAVEALKQMPERTRFMKGMFAWVGFSQASVVYNRAPRYKGKTKWNYWKLWNFAIDGITSFSALPLKVWSYLGLVISLLAFLYGAFLIARTLIFGIDVPGYASLMVVILFGIGMQLLTLGIIGEYIGRIYEEVKGRPLYFVRETFGYGEELNHSEEGYVQGSQLVSTISQEISAG